MDSNHYVRVSAALIPLMGRLFIAQRPPHKSFGLYWEFPGGKIEAGETPRGSLVREISEELCWEVRVDGLFKRIRHRRDDFGIDLLAFWCEITGGALRLQEHVAFCWASPRELSSFQLTEADRKLVPFLCGLSELPTL